DEPLTGSRTDRGGYRMTTAPLAINSPLSLETLCKVAQSQIDAMSFSELDGFVDLGIDCIALNQASIIQARQTMAPAIVRIHDALTEDSQGRRTDLMEHPPITWTTWCHNKQRLGCKRTLDALVKSAKLKLPSNVKFLTGDVAVDKGTGDEAEVVFVHETAEKIDVRYKGETEVKTVPVSDFTKPKKSACSPVGLDYLIERSKQDHDRRQQERTLKKDDRVAILGRGIAVVEHVSSKWIFAAVWNKCELRIARKEIVWDERNMRWEANDSSVSQTKPKAMSSACNTDQTGGTHGLHKQPRREDRVFDGCDWERKNRHHQPPQ